jgi:hypothetical protein
MNRIERNQFRKRAWWRHCMRTTSFASGAFAAWYLDPVTFRPFQRK